MKSKVENKKIFKSLGKNSKNLDFESADEAILESFLYKKYDKLDQVVGFKTNEFTCICPITSQPDFANIEILYIPDKLGVESKSLKLYLYSFRNHGSFHEDIVNKITNDIKNLIKPEYLRVIGDFTKRGGIAIKPLSVYKKPNTKIDLSIIDEYDKIKFEN